MSIQGWIFLVLWAIPVMFITFSRRANGERKVLWVISAMLFNYFALLVFLLLNGWRRFRVPQQNQASEVKGYLSEPRIR
jgi:hypothetical protein